MSIDSEYLLDGCFDLLLAIVLPCFLFLYSARWHFLARLALSVLVPWMLLVLSRALLGRRFEEAYYYAHPTDSNDFDTVAAGYDEVGGNVAVVFLGWTYPLAISLLTALAISISQRFKNPRSAADTAP